MNVTDKSLELKSFLLSCDRFTESHTGERIGEKFEAVCDEFIIKNKLDYIITDNAANMKRAFTICFPSSDTSKDVSPNHLDDADLWEDLDVNDMEEVHNLLDRNCKKRRLQCFAHTLQLVVGDGLKEARTVSVALGRVNRLCKLLHISTSFKEAFEQKFGSNRSIPTQ